MDSRKIRDLLDLLLRIRQHLFIGMKQNVLGVCLRRVPPLEDVLEPRAIVAPTRANDLHTSKRPGSDFITPLHGYTLNRNGSP